VLVRYKLWVSFRYGSFILVVDIITSDFRVDLKWNTTCSESIHIMKSYPKSAYRVVDDT
jgi:hypothetical protein